MKKVVSGDMVAHLWAHQSQDEARNSSDTFWFAGPVLYSYRTPIAMLHDTPRGRVALVTSDGYSVTTKTRHLNPARRAYLGVVADSFAVPYVGAYGGMAPRDPADRFEWGERAAHRDDYHEINVAHLVSEYRDLIGRIRHARYSIHDSQESVFQSLDGAAEKVRAYCAAFGLDCPALDPADEARVVWTARLIREAKAGTPQEIAKRQRAIERREERKREKAAREARERFERDAKARAQFRAGERSGYYYCRDENGGALLRYEASDDTVRTSLGAMCPAEDARRAFAVIARVRAAGATWKPAGLEGIKLGSFALNEIHSDGSIRAGCHTIHWPEIEACARALALIE